MSKGKEGHGHGHGKGMFCRYGIKDKLIAGVAGQSGPYWYIEPLARLQGPE